MSIAIGFSLVQLGWRPSFSTQMTLADFDAAYPARIAGVERSGLTVLSEHGEDHVSMPARLVRDLDSPVTVGDWVLVESASGRVRRVLERQSLVARLAAGVEPHVQPIAANLDTLFVVTSCNDEFNPSRLERYLAVAHEAGVEPVIVLTKTDLCEMEATYVAQARNIAPRVSIVAIDALTADIASVLAPWLGGGQTVAVVGSSGVGKSTLINRLVERDAQATGSIREHDARGRHTTTARHMIAMRGGAWLIDTPGMRELKVGAVEAGLGEVFADLEELATQCRYRDCTHSGDQGCALEDALLRGELDARRLSNYLKLQREAAQAARTLRERRERERRLGRMYKEVAAQRRRDRGRE
jgi:ribosome biogenesis GTPase